MLSQQNTLSEVGWWYLYLQILREDNNQWSKVMDLVDSLLPWLDFELWKQLKEKEGEEKVENPYYDQQMNNMRDGQWNTDPDNFDDLTVSDSALKGLGDMPKTFDAETFNNIQDLPDDYEDFVNNLPGGPVVGPDDEEK